MNDFLSAWAFITASDLAVPELALDSKIRRAKGTAGHSVANAGSEVGSKPALELLGYLAWGRDACRSQIPHVVVLLHIVFATLMQVRMDGAEAMLNCNATLATLSGLAGQQQPGASAVPSLLLLHRSCALRPHLGAAAVACRAQEVGKTLSCNQGGRRMKA